MSIVLNLPKALAKQLREEAQAENQPLDEYVISLLQQMRQPRQLKTAGDVLAFWKSNHLIGTRPASTNSQKLARQLRAKSQRDEIR